MNYERNEFHKQIESKLLFYSPHFQLLFYYNIEFPKTFTYNGHR